MSHILAHGLMCPPNSPVCVLSGDKVIRSSTNGDGLSLICGGVVFTSLRPSFGVAQFVREVVSYGRGVVWCADYNVEKLRLLCGGN